MFVIVFWGACHRFPLLWVKLSLVVICAQRKVSAAPFLIHSCSHFLDVISWTWLLASSLVKGSVLSLMESGLIWKMCLQTCLQMDYISHMHWPGRPAREGTITWRESYTLKWRKGAESQHAFIALCFLILDAIWLANSNSCCLQIHAMMNYFWNCESEKKMFSPLSHFYWFVSLITAIGKEIKTICFWKKTKSGTLKSLCIFHYTLPEGRKKLTSQKALNYQGYTSDELPNWLLIRTNRKIFH